MSARTYMYEYIYIYIDVCVCVSDGNQTWQWHIPLVLAHDSTYSRNETCIVTFHVSMSDYNRVSEKQGLPLRAESRELPSVSNMCPSIYCI